MEMKAARLYGANDLRIMQIPVPELKGNEVRIAVKYCGICATDHSIYSGESSFIEAGLIRYPMTLGHEYSGVIDAVGCDVTRFKVGDRVVADTGVSCGVCDVCREGDYLNCEHMQAVGTINAIDGGYAQYTVMPERHVFSLPDNISFQEGALVEPIATGLNSVKKGDIKIGDDVLVIGTGPIGLGAVPFVKYSGAKNVILAGRKDFKLDVGKKLGADITINTTKEDLYSRIMEITDGKGPNVIIESSGNADMLILSTKMIAMSGRISVVAFYEQPINNLDIDLAVIKDVQIISVMGSPNMGQVVLKMMATKKIDFSPMITGVYPLDDVKSVLDDYKNDTEKKIKRLLEI